MDKVTMTISVDSDVKRLSQMRFPRKVSSIINDFLRRLCDIEISDYSNLDPQALEQEKREAQTKIEEETQKIRTLEAQMQELNKAKEKEEEMRQLLARKEIDHWKRHELRNMDL